MDDMNYLDELFGLTDEEKRLKQQYHDEYHKFQSLIKEKVIPKSKYKISEISRPPLFMFTSFGDVIPLNTRPDIIYNNKTYVFHTNKIKTSWRILQYLLDDNYCVLDNAVDSNNKRVDFFYAVYKVKK